MYLQVNTMNKVIQQPLIQKIWRSGNALVITIPNDVIKKYNLKEGQRIGVNIPFKEQKTKKGE